MGSHYGDARRNDPDVAEWIASLPDDEDKRWRPEGTDWSLFHELMAANYDRLGQLISLVADLPTTAKKCSKPPQTFPRPTSAIAKAKVRHQQARLAELEQDVREAQARWLAMQQEADGR